MMPDAETESGWSAPTDRLVLRFTRTATRRLHPAEDCFRGAGYKINPMPLQIDGQGRKWSAFAAEKSGRSIEARTCVISVPDGDLRQAEPRLANRPSWPDVSSWYWAVARPGSERSATVLAVTVITESLQ
jgi:hypothetical protein